MTPAERQQRRRAKRREATAEDLFLFMNIFPRRTGLPMTVWIRPRSNERHAARIKVNTRHGERMTLEDAAVVGLEPEPEVLIGELSADDRDKVFAWIALNKEALLDHWHGRIDALDLGERLRKLPEA